MTTQLSARPAPVGRAAVVAAVLAAAADLYAEKGPAATSIREVACCSGVNHGLVFRYFGTKDQLVGATLEHLGRRVAELLEQQASMEDIEDALTLQSVVMARALLEGFPVAEYQTTFPAVALLLDRIAALHDCEHTARLAAANAVALQLGWRLFAPFLRASAGLDHMTAAEVREAILAATTQLVDPQKRWRRDPADQSA